MKVSEIGEFGLIDRLARIVGRGGDGVVKGIGDDAAVLEPAVGGGRLLASCDMQVDGYHFELEQITPEQLGHRVLAVNISDIAAMGGRPRWALVTLGLTPDIEVEFAERLYRGLHKLAEEFGVSIVGGDTCRSPERLVVDVAILGEAHAKGVLLRSGARPGDLLLVTGEVGSSAAGLACLRAQEELDRAGIGPETTSRLVSAFLTPIPRIGAGRFFVECGLVTSTDDISDGLASETNEIAQASGVGFRVWAEHLPVAPETKEVAGVLGEDPLRWALYGGEDFELLFTLRPGSGSQAVEDFIQAAEEAAGIPVTVIGEAVPASEGVKLVHGGEMTDLRPGGYDHFRD